MNWTTQRTLAWRLSLSGRTKEIAQMGAMRSSRDRTERRPQSKSAAEFEAQANALLEASPENRATWNKFQRFVATNGERLMNALKRNGFEGEPSAKTLMAAWRSVGLPIEDFGRSSSPYDLIEVLEARANIRERTHGFGAPTSPLLRKKAGIVGGRPKGKTCMINIRGELLLKRRGDQSQKQFALWLRIKRSTYQRAEDTCLATEKTAVKIAERLGLDLHELIRP
jgi:hypothetical protein